MSSPSPSPVIFTPTSSALLRDLQPAYSYAWAAFVFFLGWLIYTSTRSKTQYDHIPAIGSTTFFSSYLEAFKLIRGTNTLLQEGYDKYKNGVFRIPEITRWHVMVSGEQLIDELRKAPDNTLSFDEATNESLAIEYTLGPNVATNLYHIPVVRVQLTRNLGARFHDLQEEVMLAFQDNIPVTDGWTKVKALDTVMQIVSRASNRVFVGAPKCRDPEYTALNIQFTIDVVLGSQIINFFPNFLRPLAGSLLTNVPKAIRTGLKHLGPIIEERKRKIEEYGPDYPDKPNDMLSWLMDAAVGEEQTTRNLTLRILVLNFAAIHTSSMSFTHALFYLASQPEYIQPIREEVEAVVAEEGWSKIAMTRMRKLDSFLKESQRLTGLGPITMMRKALKDFTFSDGTHIPKGTFVSVVSTARQRDSDVYPNGETFDGFRFSNIRSEEGEGTKNQMVATSTEYMPFGHGRHACPGRFFAALELKAMLAHIVLTYDIKMEDEGVRPADQWFSYSCIPNRHAEVLFRKRQS